MSLKQVLLNAPSSIIPTGVLCSHSYQIYIHDVPLYFNWELFSSLIVVFLLMLHKKHL